MILFAVAAVLWAITCRICYVLGYNEAIDVSRSLLTKLIILLEHQTQKEPQDD